MRKSWNVLPALLLLAPVAISCVTPGPGEKSAVGHAGQTVAAGGVAPDQAGVAVPDQNQTAPGAGTCAAPSDPNSPALSEDTAMSRAHDTIHKTEAEWRDVLTPEQYYVTRQHGTEPAFTGKYWHFDGQGVYRCVCCGQELFRSDQKYDSGTGWPSFWAPIDDGRLKLVEDRSLGMDRIEVRCGRCGAHLGHLFDDGPRPTGQRYCLNSASLDFQDASGAKGDTANAKADVTKK